MRSSEERAKIALFALTLVGASGLAIAQAPKAPADTIQFRQQQMKSIGGAFKAVTDEMKAPSPNFDTIRTNAQTMQKLAADVPSWFPAGTGPETGVKMTAKAEIWTAHADFEDKARGLQTAVQGLVAASAGNDVAALGAAVRPVGQACQGCHTQFRVLPPRPAAPPAAAPATPPAAPSAG